MKTKLIFEALDRRLQTTDERKSVEVENKNLKKAIY